MEMSMCCSQSQVQELSFEQKFGLEQLLAVRKRLKHSSYKKAVKGFEGMKVADEYLKRNDASGVLIGGLSEAIWDRNRSDEYLTYHHKDVDVAVIKGDSELFRGFDEGVDWWVLQNGKVDISSYYTEGFGVEKEWDENGNGVIPTFLSKRRDTVHEGSSHESKLCSAGDRPGDIWT